MNREEFDRLLEKARYLCSRTEKCSSEILMKLGEWGMSDEGDRNRALSLLVDEKFVDDTRYADHYISDKVRFNKWGIEKVRAMLRGKGLSPEIVAGAIEKIDRDEYLHILREELLKKRRTIKPVNRFDLKGKLFRFAASRGYEYDLIYRLIDEILNEPDTELNQ